MWFIKENLKEKERRRNMIKKYFKIFIFFKFFYVGEKNKWIWKNG